jgi:hypothetical protein
VVFKNSYGGAVIFSPAKNRRSKDDLEWFATKASTPRLAFRHALSLTLILTLKICEKLA